MYLQINFCFFHLQIKKKTKPVDYCTTELMDAGSNPATFELIYK